MTKPFPILIAMILLFVTSTSVLIFQWLHPSLKMNYAAGGILDARDWDYQKNGVLPLRGQWEFYPNQLLTPADFRSNPVLPATGKLINVPGSWKDEVSADGKAGYGAGTYRLVVQVEQPGIYSVRAKKTRLSSRWFINGTELGGNGKPSLLPEEFIPSNFPFFGSEKVEAGPVEIVIQVASLRFFKGGLIQAPEFGPLTDMARHRDKARLTDMVLLTTMVVFGLYFAGMFRQWSKERHLMFLSLFCLAAGVFFSIDNEILAAALFPELPFVWLQKILFITALLSFLFFSLYIYRYLDELDRPFFRTMRWIAYAYCLVILFGPNDYLGYTQPFNILLQAATFIDIFVVLFRLRNRGLYLPVFMALNVFFMILTWISAQYRYELGMDHPYFMIVTPLLLVFSLAFLSSNRLQRAFVRNEQLSLQLIAHDRHKDEFLAKTSHELRTPLHGIINLSQTLLDDREAALSPQHRENIRLMNLVGRRLAGLIHDILDMSQIRAGRLRIHQTPVDLGMTVRLVFDMLSIAPRNKQVALLDELSPELPLVLADENRLRQIVYNLLENGMKFTDRGSVRIYARKHGDELAITVADTGIGMAPEQLARVFDPFETSSADVGDRSGIGLGLSITKQLVELQGGRLEVVSQQGQGSAFTFFLPIAEPGERDSPVSWRSSEEETEDFPESLVAAASDGVTVLIVDDERSNLKIGADAVLSMNYAYKAVQSGGEALEYLAQSPPPDLVLLDLMMPGISGLDVCREIRKLHNLAELPVLMLTASGQHGDILASFQAGANDILQKPFELAELKARVRSLVAVKRSSEQAVRREMDFLQAQITPHFLYNSMNALVGLSYKDVDKLRETIDHLATYLRAKFTFVFQGNLVPFEKELELVRAYLAIEQLRFGSRLEVRYRLETDLNFKIPPLTLQPLVENAVRHGIGPKPSGGTVEIRVFRDRGGAVNLVVEDDGVGMDEETLTQLTSQQRTGIGIGNVNRRLQMLYAQKLHIRSRPGEGARFQFKLPEGLYDQSDLD
ncbi:hybrid sensor histidine kinase/response regulator [Paenibacillus puerhi]|uniref:hybrid sensor histidine kinase/response regulator n=1 Tax=Paenibacillus puerhi TaxID=2692622 RepID=UPI00135779F8|nr:ATP-binding protein [Paenibacillus puerhi]